LEIQHHEDPGVMSLSVPEKVDALGVEVKDLL
jgi:hypothetical protein